MIRMCFSYLGRNDNVIFFRGINSMEAESQYLLYYKWGALALLSSLGENALLMPEVGE